jgi:phage terminase large subunit GpA-like protein
MWRARTGKTSIGNFWAFYFPSHNMKNLLSLHREVTLWKKENAQEELAR